MPRKFGHIILLLLVLLTSCKTTKFVSDGDYLLNKSRIRVLNSPTDTKSRLDARYEAADLESDLKDYLRQTPNTEILGFWKLQLQMYNTAPKDTSTKAKRFFARNAHKMGEAPVIYDEELTRLSIDQLRLAMQNKGFFSAQVDTIKRFKDKKLDLTYLIHANAPYTIRRYHIDIAQPQVREIALESQKELSQSPQFDAERLEDERKRIATRMHNEGYFYFDKSMLVYRADSSYRDNTVDLTLSLADYIESLPDSAQQRLYTRYTIRRVFFHCDDEAFLRERVLRRHCLIEEGKPYAEWRVERTYSYLNSLGAIRYVDIAFDPVAQDQLDCHITISKSKVHALSVEAEGTYSAGDWGIGIGAGYQNRNLFHGAELLSLSAKASYEWRQSGGRAIEAKAEAGLTFPNQLKINAAYNYQQRPEEYTRTIANAGLYYTIPRRLSRRWTHQFNLIDISYIYLPWMSERFKADFIDRASVLKASYEDHFILDWSYSGQYTNRRPNSHRSYVQFRYAIETAGNFLYGIGHLFSLPRNDQGAFTLGHIPFAQYAKADLNFSFHHSIAPRHCLVYHAALGVALPYGNANTIPFEKRYFSGGANSVRGWQARTLGPGAFRGQGNTLVYDLQAGDIRLDLNLEYRWRVWSLIELAAFFDAGNIWTMYNYEQQPYGVWDWQEFYRQIALSWGFGLRLDFSLVILRVDLGVKLHDPTRLYGDLDGTQWRTARHNLNWRDDCTLHFAIGYPF